MRTPHPARLLPLLFLPLLLHPAPALATPAPSPSTSPTPTALPLALLSTLSSIEHTIYPAPRLTIDDVAVATTLPDDADIANSGGLTADPCVSTADCEQPRNCIQVIERTRVSICNPTFDSPCFCFPLIPVFCSSTEVCDEGEVCAEGTKNDAIKPLCLSESIVTFTDELERIDPNRDDEDRGPTSNNNSNNPPVAVDGASFEGDGCIDAALIPSAHNLVYNSHRKRTVLCDRTGSCATPGHVVVWNGTPMMMRSYCRLVPCATDIRWVNSPRWARRLRIHAPTPGLAFTAFAARFQSVVEERALSLAVRMSL